MLITKEVEMSWNNTIKDWYINKGYIFTKIRDKFIVKVADLSKHSNKIVEVLCDYCKENKIITTYGQYLEKRIVVEKDSCSKCRGKKTRDSNLIKYGIESTNQLLEIKNKKAEKQKHPYEYVYNFFKEHECILISKIYINANKKLEYICLKHKDKGIQTVRFKHFKEGHGCYHCGLEKRIKKRTYTIDYARERYNEFNYELLDTEYKGCYHKMKYRCKNHYRYIQECSLGELSTGRGCKYCSIENNGHTISLKDHLRVIILQWKNDTVKLYNNKCALTNSAKNIVIHHLYSFNKIFDEIFEQINLPIYLHTIDYCEDDLILIENKCLELHYKYGLGICITKNIHKLYHKIYGRKNNTPLQFELFNKRYYNGDFNNLLLD